MSGILCAAAMGGTGTSIAGSGTMTAGTSGNYRGYISPTYQSITGQPACGSLSGSAGIGTIGAFVSNTVGSIYQLIFIGAPSLTPTGIDIEGVLYPLTFLGSGSGLYLYDIVGHPVYTNGVTYDWILYV